MSILGRSWGVYGLDEYRMVFVCLAKTIEDQPLAVG
jgi:hypothetical protein